MAGAARIARVGTRAREEEQRRDPARPRWPGVRTGEAHVAGSDGDRFFHNARRRLVDTPLGARGGNGRDLGPRVTDTYRRAVLEPYVHPKGRELDAHVPDLEHGRTATEERSPERPDVSVDRARHLRY
jgi:hypothetical protein